MKHLIRAVLYLLPVLVFSQVQTDIAEGETGATLLNTLRQNYTPSTTLGYDNARDVLYGTIDVDENDSLRCIYTGFTIYLAPNADPSTDAYNKHINCEHCWPQSMGAEEEPMRSNMHHLFPAKDNVNSARGNDPYGEIEDILADTWYWKAIALTSIPSSNIDEYSEKENDSSPQRFEPRESVKGDIARAAFYFFAIYNSVADTNFWNYMKDDLIDWHYQDPVTVEEQARSNQIASYQNNKYNPFCFDSTLARRAWYTGTSGGGGTATADIDSYPYSTGFENGGSEPEGWSASGFYITTTSVYEGSYGYRCDAGTSPDLLITPSFDLTGVGGGTLSVWLRPTGTAYADFGEVSLYADTDNNGTYDTELVTYSDNTPFADSEYRQVQIDISSVIGKSIVRFRFAFSRATGNGGNWNADNFLLETTEPTGTLFINELDIDSPGTDTDEFVELCGNAGTYSNVVLKLINGNGNVLYGTIEIGNITLADESQGYGFYVWAPMANTRDAGSGVIDLQSDGSGASSIQNGDPDGVQLEVNGEIVDAVSYEDSGDPMLDTGGSAMEQTNIADEFLADKSIGRVGTDGSNWELMTRSPGSVNTVTSTGLDQSLPVTLSVFSGKLQNGAVVLFWSTSSEIENMGFVLYRTETESGSDMHVLASFRDDPALEGQGTTSEIHNYSYADMTVLPGRTYTYILGDVDSSGKETRHYESSFTISMPAADVVTPGSYVIGNAYPNPFNPSITIPFSLKEKMHVTVTLHDAAGRQMSIIADSYFDAGDHEIAAVPGANAGPGAAVLPSGVYFLNYRLGYAQETRKILLLK